MAEHLGQHGGDHAAPGWSDPTLDSGRGQRSRDSIGRLLRRTREHHGLDLRQVADQLRIRFVYLDAIERSRFDELPGPTYAVGFVRSYADFLGLDDGEVVRRFKDEVEGIDRTQQLHFPKPVSEAKVPGGAILLVSLVLIAAAYGGWQFLTSQGASVDDLVPAVPERLKALVGAGGESDVLASGSATTAGESADGVGGGAGASGRPAAQTTAATAEPAGVEAGAEPAAEAAAAARGETGAAAAPAAPEQPETEAASGSADAAEAPESAVTAAPDSGAAVAAVDPASAPAPGEAAPAPEGASAPESSTVPEATSTPEAMTREATTPQTRTGSAGESEAPPAIPGAPDAGSTGQGAVPEPPSGEAGSAVAAATGRVFGAGNADSRITLQASEDSWVQVRGPDDSLLLTRVLHPGDIYKVPARNGLVLHTGNAGGLTILVDGQPLASLGETGEVRRNIRLDPGSLRQGRL